MTEDAQSGGSSAAATVDFAAVENSWRKRLQLAAAIRPGNQARLLAALAAAGVVKVTVAFDGCGDSGQIESIDARDRVGEVALPDVGVEITMIADHSLETRAAVMPLRELVEEIAYALLGETHGGWQDNEGAFGEFTFDVIAGEIRLEFNERIVSSEYHEHSW